MSANTIEEINQKELARRAKISEKKTGVKRSPEAIAAIKAGKARQKALRAKTTNKQI